MLLIDELFRLMTKKGAGKVVCLAPKSEAVNMASVRFYATSSEPDSDSNLTYQRYSDKFLDTVVTKLEIKAYRTSRGDK